MLVRHISLDQRKEWNAWVAQEPHFALLQSWDWGEFKQRLGWKPFRIAITQQDQIVVGVQMLIKPLPSALASVAYIPRSPIDPWKKEEALSLLLDELHRVAKKHKAIFLKIEPALPYDPKIHQFLKRNHFHPSPFTNQPRATIIVDLTPELDGIMKQVRQKTRQYIRKALRDGITVRRGGDEGFEAFYSLMRIIAKHNNFPIRVRTYYHAHWKTLSQNKRTILLMAYQGNTLLAVRTAYKFGDHAAEFHAGSIDISNNLRPNHLLVWEAIEFFKFWSDILRYFPNEFFTSFRFLTELKSSFLFKLIISIYFRSV